MFVPKKLRLILWGVISTLLVLFVALGVQARSQAEGLQTVGSAKVSWPKAEDSLNLPGQPRPLRFILWGNGNKSSGACGYAAKAAERHILDRFRNASARRMHLSKKKGHEFLLGDSEKILRFYANSKIDTDGSELTWALLSKTTTDSIQGVLNAQKIEVDGQCLFLVVDEVNVLQASIRVLGTSPERNTRENELIKRALSRSIHQWSTFRFLADVPMLRKQLTDPSYRRQMLKESQEEAQKAKSIQSP